MKIMKVTPASVFKAFAFICVSSALLAIAVAARAQVGVLETAVSSNNP